MSTSSEQQTPKSASEAGKVETEETLRPPETAVVTSDLPEAEEEPEKKAESTAEAGDKKQGSKDQESATDDPEKTEPQKKRKYRGNRANRRLRKQLAEQQREIDELKTLFKSGTQAPVDNQEPKLEDFDSPQEYAKAYSQWERKSESPQQGSTSTKETEQPSKEELQEIDNFYQAGLKKYGDEYAEAVTEPDLRIDKPMAEFMMDSEFGHDIMMHLANNPEESEKMYQTSERRMVRQMMDLEDKAKNGKLDIGVNQLDIDKGGKKDGEGKGGGKETPTKKAGSEKFTPPSSTKETGTPVSETDMESASMDDYAATRRKQMKQQGIR